MVLAGKTTTLTARIVRLLLEGRRPLAALTFTRKGATELERRIRGGLGSVLADRNAEISVLSPPRGEIGERDLFVGTFHSFFMKLLRNHGGPLGVPSNFRVLGQFQQLALLRNLIEQEKRSEAQRRGVVGKGISATLRSNPGDHQMSSDDNEGCSEDEREVQDSLFLGDGGLAFSSTSREAEELRRRIRAMKFIPELLQRERASGSVLFRLFCKYTRHLKEQQPPLLDFTDLTVLAIRLLERADMRAQLRSLWPYLVVDEFQDTNSNQFKFLCLLALGESQSAQQRQGGITVMGDDDQSIYKWRGTHTGVCVSSPFGLLYAVLLLVRICKSCMQAAICLAAHIPLFHCGCRLLRYSMNSAVFSQTTRSSFWGATIVLCRWWSGTASRWSASIGHSASRRHFTLPASPKSQKANPSFI